METGIIYCLKNKMSGKVYIGKSKKTLQQRTYDHWYQARRVNEGTYYKSFNRHLIYAIIKTPDKEDWELTVVEDKVNLQEINSREKYWISYFNSNNPDIGYNLTAGGDGGNTTLSKEGYVKWSEGMRQHHPMYKDKSSPEYQAFVANMRKNHPRFLPKEDPKYQAWEKNYLDAMAKRKKNDL